MKHYKLGLLGLGTVGRGVIETLVRNRDEIARKSGYQFTVTQVVVRDVQRAQQYVDQLAPKLSAPIRVSADASALIDDDTIDCIVEVMGGLEPARQHLLQAISAGKPVVTANKALLANCGTEIFARVQETGGTIAFEASVAGGTPIIKILREALTANRVSALGGIINGTCNYILSNMQSHRMTFQSALTLSQERGYAEANPAADVDGIDSAQKLSILAALAFGVPLNPDAVSTQSIRDITLADIDIADALGYRIKQIAIAQRVDAGLEMRVYPAFIEKHHVLANTHDAMNAVWVHTDTLGDLLCTAAGAGALPTASAVVADIIDIARARSSGDAPVIPATGFLAESIEALPIIPLQDTISQYCLQLSTAQQPLGDHIHKILTHAGIAIKTQQTLGDTIAMVTERIEHAKIQQVCDALAQVDDLTQPPKWFAIANVS